MSLIYKIDYLLKQIKTQKYTDYDLLKLSDLKNTKIKSFEESLQEESLQEESLQEDFLKYDTLYDYCKKFKSIRENEIISEKLKEQLCIGLDVSQNVSQSVSQNVSQNDSQSDTIIIIKVDNLKKIKCCSNTSKGEQCKRNSSYLVKNYKDINNVSLCWHHANELEKKQILKHGLCLTKFVKK